MTIRALIVYISGLVFIKIAGMRTFSSQSVLDVILSITPGSMLSRAIIGHFLFIPCMIASKYKHTNVESDDSFKLLSRSN